MSEPVLVVHGVGNRKYQDKFEESVVKLQEALGDDRFQLVPVFWGDLGAYAEEDVFDTLPEMPIATRGAGAAPLAEPERETLVAAALGAGDGDLARAEQEEAIVRGAHRAARESTRTLRPPDGGDEEIRRAVRDELPNTRYLKQVRDPAVLEAVGRVLGEAAAGEPLDDEAEHGASPGGYGGASPEEPDSPYATRGATAETRGISRLSKALLGQIDNLVGTAVGDALGRANQNVRGVVGDEAVGFFGDILVYQRNRDEIHQRLRNAIDHTPGAEGYGEEGKPISVIAHSLGGVASFDAAVAGKPPLWIKSLVTFGSQPAFFHVIDRREELAPYKRGAPVRLPRTIRRWRNLWEPMDFLAFAAGRVFELDTGERPRDERVGNRVSLLLRDKGMTHSSYWESEELARALRETLPL